MRNYSSSNQSSNRGESGVHWEDSQVSNSQNTDRRIDREDDDDSNDSDRDFSYPRLYFKGSGTSTCNGKTYTQAASVNAELFKESLNVDMTAAALDCDGECKKRSDERLRENAIGNTIYKRTSSRRLKGLKDEGFEYRTYLIYADSVRKKDGTVYTFDKPLPVFPVPAPKARFRDFNAPLVYRANATSGPNRFPVTVAVTNQGLSGDLITLNFQTDIVDPTWAIYEKFPIAYQSTFIVNLLNKDIRQLITINRWYGDQNCNRKKETSSLTYRLCRKVKNGVTEDVEPCN